MSATNQENSQNSHIKGGGGNKIKENKEKREYMNKRIYWISTICILLLILNKS